MISGGPRLEWMPYLLLWLGLIIGAAVGALMFGIFGYNSLLLPAAYAGIFALVLLAPHNRFGG
jgi:uncharacterized membrane protein YoaK (UPF0700 family)